MQEGSSGAPPCAQARQRGEAAEVGAERGSEGEGLPRGDLGSEPNLDTARAVDWEEVGERNADGLPLACAGTQGHARSGSGFCLVPQQVPWNSAWNP
jgi:hypothetical protein